MACRNLPLEEKIQRCPSRSRIDLRKYRLTDSDMDIVIRQAVFDKQCTLLWLVENQLTSASVLLLASSLKSGNVSLEGLSLCHNGISDQATSHLAQLLSMPSVRLTRLALTMNEITDRGAQSLADMLRTNRTLTQLWLGFNRLTDHGVRLLTSALAEHNSTLHVLSLSGNTLMTDASVDGLVAMLDGNATLRMVAVANCNLSATSKIRLEQAAKLRGEFYFDL